MSEYQYVEFRAIDRRVSKDNVAYMVKQSSRAEVTDRRFVNEYHYGDFRGNSVEMLRRGYDIHLHYANFGTRTLMIRLPIGLPKGADPYIGDRLVKFIPDAEGPGGVLSIDPGYESGQLNDIWNFDDVLQDLVKLRADLVKGDLRPLYLAHLAVLTDLNQEPNAVEGPVPAGLSKLTVGQKALVELYELGAYLVPGAGLKGKRDSTDTWPTEQRGLTISALSDLVMEADRKAKEKTEAKKKKAKTLTHPVPDSRAIRVERRPS
jgi:hypothetical protein